MSYQVLARKWRPRSFQTLVGQEHVVRALVNALDQNRLHHAYLFTGTRGVGKTTLARILAKCLNCEAGVSSNPCGKCHACQAIDAGRFVDLIEVDAASRTKVEDTRELLENVQYTPTQGRYKIYLIDEVHMLSGHSFNALLKTLEEPPPHVKFLLATTDPQKLPITVLSRCLQFHLKNMPTEKIAAHLAYILNEEKINFENEALHLLAHAANGSMRDALSLLDQAIAYGNGQVQNADIRIMLGTIEQTFIFNLLTALAENNANAILMTINNLAEQAADFSQVLEDLLSLLHQLALVQVLPNAPLDASDPERIRTLAKRFTGEDIQLYYQIGLIGRRDLTYAPSFKSGFEMIMLRMLAFRPTPIDLPGASPAQTKIAPQSPPTSTKSSQNSSETNWSTLLSKLNLTGASRALATHCTLAKTSGDEISLLLDPSQAPLLTANQKQRIAAALETYLQKPVKLSIEIGKMGMDTPAAMDKQQQAERQATASKTIAQDQNVQAIIQTFNGRIVPETTKGIE